MRYSLTMTCMLGGLLVASTLSGCLASPSSHPPLPYQPPSATSLNAPISPFTVLSWANEAAVAAQSYNFATYEQNFTAASQYFTPEGWAAYQTVLQQSGNLQHAIDKKLIVTAVATGAPIILQQGTIGERYTWRVQIPMTITRQSATETEQQPVIVNLLITRCPPNQGVNGLAITQFIVTAVPNEKGQPSHVLVSPT